MDGLLSNPILLFPAFAISVFFFAYFSADTILGFLYKRSLGSREEVIEILDKMLVKVDKQKITLALLLLSFGVGFIFFLLLWPNIIAGLITGSTITVVGWSLPKNILQARWEKRCNQVVAEMVDGLTIMGNGIKAGLSVPQTLERVVENMGGYIGQEFGLILNKVSLGMSLEDALNEFDERMNRQDVQMLVTAINILKETGGNLGETFETIVLTIRDRQKIERKIEAMTAQAMMQGRIMTAIPFILLVVFYLVDPGYVTPLFTTVPGWIALGMTLALQVVGSVVIKRMVAIKV